MGTYYKQTKSVKSYEYKYIFVLMENIKVTLPKKKLEEYFEGCLSGREELINIAKMYGFNYEALSCLFNTYLGKKEKTKIKEKEKETNLYPIETLITNLTIYNRGKHNAKIKITYLNKEEEVVEYSKESCTYYKNKIFEDGKKLIKVNLENKKAPNKERKKTSSVENLLVYKWSNYFDIESKNKEVKLYNKKYETEENIPYVEARILNYKKINSLSYSRDSFKEDMDFINNYYNNKVMKR